MTATSQPPRLLIALGLLFGFALLAGSTALVLYRPDRPVPDIAPGSSAGPAFVVQIIRPRMGLPLAGLLPPQLVGLDGHLGFGSASPGATVGSVGPRRIELAAEGWELVLVADEEGRVTAQTQVVFELVFEDRPRTVRCRAVEPATGTFATTALAGGELGGRFHVELARCEDASTGESLGWPPDPLVLHGSFDRLPLSPGE